MTQTTLPRTGYLTVAEVAGTLRMSRMTVYRLLADGTLPSIRIGKRAYRIPAAAFWTYLDDLGRRPSQPPAVIPGQTEISA